METLSNILASFDIFQVILSVFPDIFNPLFNALKGMVMTLVHTAGEQFTAHPGLISGSLIFLLIYLAWSGLTRKRQTAPVKQKTAQTTF